MPQDGGVGSTRTVAASQGRLSMRAVWTRWLPLAETPYSGPAQPGARIKLISSVNSRWVKASRSLESSVAVAFEVAPAGAVGGHDEMGRYPVHGFSEATVVVAVSFR
ncbi:hypothetical protein SacazDRAFT_02443 [Saccharomonospora azurea NA-128]|uniref:Uncharacterized protein n=1 Tax=Saccharomonospora azurea NA-128 TaxID=882081 RepID=H8G7F1_9PSEU|nr:hypothetical protein SacazDRAFT_02443 [Saccharomonospora azurea NA-128]